MPLPLTGLLVALGLGSWANALYFLGVGSKPSAAGADPYRTVGWISFVTGLIIGGFGVIYLVTLPKAFGDQLAVAVGGLAVGFGFVWVLLGIIQLQGLDLRPLGNICFWVGVFTVIFIWIFRDLFLFWSTMAIWAIGLFMVTAVSYGSLSPRVLGFWLLLFAIWTTFLPAALISLGRPLF